MTLTLVYRLNGLIGLIWAASMLFGTNMMAASYGWEVTAPMVTMAQFLAMSFFFIAVVFIMLPNWTSEEQLKKSHEDAHSSSNGGSCDAGLSYNFRRHPFRRHAIKWNRPWSCIHHTFLLEIKIKNFTI